MIKAWIFMKGKRYAGFNCGYTKFLSKAAIFQGTEEEVQDLLHPGEKMIPVRIKVSEVKNDRK